MVSCTFFSHIDLVQYLPVVCHGTSSFSHLQDNSSIFLMYSAIEAQVAQSVERLTANVMTPDGLWFNPQSRVDIFSGLLSTQK